jgi:hypothetical protein
MDELREPKTFREFLHVRFSRREKHLMGDKLAIIVQLNKAGLETAKTYATINSAESISSLLKKLPDQFVLKPNLMAGSRGVMVLNRIAGGHGYWDSKSQQRRWVSGIKKEFLEVEALHREKFKGRPFAIIAEETIISESSKTAVPLDYKFYTFNGRVRLIIQIDRNSKLPTVHFFDRNFERWAWQDYIEINPERLQAGEAAVPGCAQDMLRVVEKASRLARTPFVSVDMYASTRGPIIGEMTTAPGGPYFRRLFTFKPAYDAELGLDWRRASVELGRPIIPFDPTEEIPVHRKWMDKHKTAVTKGP